WGFRVNRLYLCRFVGTYWRTRTNQHTVALRIVDTPHRGPKFVTAHKRQWKSCLRTGIRLVPGVGAYHGDGMRCALQEVIRPISLALFNSGYLFTDGNHRIAETIKLSLRFRLGRFYHQRPRNGKRHRGGMKTVVHQSLGDIAHFDTHGLECT